MNNNDRPNYYAVISAEVRYDERLTDKEKLLYGEIAALTAKTNECWASNSYFAELYRITPQSVSRMIRHLKQYGYIDTKILYEEGTKKINKRILILNPAPINTNVNTPYHKCLDPINTNVNTPINTNVKENNTSNEYYKFNNNKPPISPFDVFWKAYPKKIEKKKARQIFEKKIDEPTLALILQDLEKRKQYEGWTKDKGKYIPHPTTYLNQERWEDEYETGPTSDKRSFMDLYKERYQD